MTTPNGATVHDTTDSDLRALFRLEATEAATHARCGHARCRLQALADVDKILDEWLTRHGVEVPALPEVGAGAEHGS